MVSVVKIVNKCKLSESLEIQVVLLQSVEHIYKVSGVPVFSAT